MPSTVPFGSAVRWVESIHPQRLGLVQRPFGGERLEPEISYWKASGVGSVVSLLEASEVDAFSLQDEGAVCARYGLRFTWFPIPNGGVPPTTAAMQDLAAALHQDLLQNLGVLIHCRAGIGRTGLVAACLLHRLGHSSATIFQGLSLARGFKVPDNPEQVQWFMSYAKAVDFAPSHSPGNSITVKLP